MGNHHSQPRCPSGYVYNFLKGCWRVPHPTAESIANRDFDRKADSIDPISKRVLSEGVLTGMDFEDIVIVGLLVCISLGVFMGYVRLVRIHKEIVARRASGKAGYVV